MPSNRQLLRDWGLRPKKSWGQNFLEDGNALERIARACDLQPGECVVEIGAGLGAFTDRLHGDGRRVIAVERDRDLAPVLRERFADTAGVTILEENALNVDAAAIASQNGVDKIKVVGNLPYQLSAPIMFWLIEQRAFIKSAHALLQTEVAQRLYAEPKTKDFSLLTVLLGRVADVWKETDIKPTCFVPPPKVGSRFVSIRFNAATDDGLDDRFFADFVKGCFHQRRKTLANSLARQNFMPLSSEKLDALRTRFPDFLQARPDALAVSDFIEMARFLANA